MPSDPSHVVKLGDHNDLLYKKRTIPLSYLPGNDKGKPYTRMLIGFGSARGRIFAESVEDRSGACIDRRKILENEQDN